MIVYVTRWLGGFQGAGKSAWDALGGILATGQEVQIVAGHAVDLPDMIAGQPTNRANVATNGGGFRAAKRLVIDQSRRLLRPLLREPKVAHLLHGLNDRFQSRSRNSTASTSFAQTPDLVVVNSLGSHGEFAALNHRDGTPSVLIVRESPGHYQHDGVGSGYAEAVAAMSEYDALIFVSSRCRDAWLEETAFRSTPTFYIPNCCEEEEVLNLRTVARDDVRRQWKFDKRRFIAVCVASLQHRKGQDLVVEQLPRIVEKIPNFELHLVGADSRGFGKQLRAAARATGLAGRIHFHGASDSALACLHAADAMLLPARAEAMPRVVLEAMALGTPVIASDVDGIPELIDHGQGGWLFPIEQPAEMLDGLWIAAHDRGQTAAWIDESKRRYWQDFSQNLLVRRYADVLNSLIATGGSPLQTPTNRSRAA